MAKRAMTEEAKRAKAEAILDRTQEMFLSIGYEKIKMSDIAKSMNISNGLLFVYFKTKETLFMCMLWREYEKRLDYLIDMAKKTTIKSYADVKQLFMSELAILVDSNPLYIRLESMRSAIFEKNTGREVMFNMKKQLFERTQEFTSLVSRSGVLTQAQLIDIFFTEAAIITGSKLGTDLPEDIRNIIQQIGADGFVRDFKKDVTEAVGCFLDGFGQKLLRKKG